KAIAEQREFVLDPATQIGVGIDPGITQAVSAASDPDPKTGQLVADKLARWKLTKGQVKHASGLNNSHRDTQRWLAPIWPHLQHLAAASSAGTSLVANLKHTTTTLATWDAVWEMYLDPKWARQRQRLYGGQDPALEQFFKEFEEDMAEVLYVGEYAASCLDHPAKGFKAHGAPVANNGITFIVAQEGKPNTQLCRGVNTVQ
ncbi:uncharacterized protein HaLaN_10281, partial [Haematococcus lacustris]